MYETTIVDRGSRDWRLTGSLAEQFMKSNMGLLMTSCGELRAQFLPISSLV